jgi:hypothetical protein
MTVSDEVKAVIKVAATEAAEAAVNKAMMAFAENQRMALKLHEAECTGRKVGKVLLIAATAAAGTAGATAGPLIKAILGAFNGQ